MISKIFGPPGTGKTTRLLKEIIDSGIPWNKVLYISLTNAAVSEAVSRAKIAGASSEDLAWFHTQHSIDRKLLGLPPSQLVASHIDEFAELYRYKFSDSGARRDIIEVSVSLPGDKKFPDQFLIDNYDKARNLMIDWSSLLGASAALRPYRLVFAQFVERFENWKRDNGYLDFLDLIIESRRRELIPPVDLLAVDECQDASPLLLHQVEFWTKKISTCFLAGDQNQAIYTFMGTVPSLFKNFPCDREIKLELSHRVPQCLRDKALSIIHKNRGEENFTFDSVSSEGKHIILPTIYSAMTGIKQLGNKYSYFLLARNRFHLNEAAALFRKEGIPCGGRQEEIEAVKLLHLRPTTITRYEAEILISPLFPAVTSKNSNGAWRHGAKSKIQSMFEKGFSPIETTNLEKIGATPRLIAALQTSDTSILKMSGDDIRYYERVLKNFDGRLDLVKPLTIHGSKGREADIVILLSEITRRTHEEESHGDIESERRVYYVAVTRAKHALIEVRDYSSYRTGIL